MQNIFRLFQKYSTVFIFLILQLICMGFIFSKSNPYQHSKFANSSNQFIGGIYEVNNNVKSYLYLKEENELLKAQNKALLDKVNSRSQTIGNYFSLLEDTLYQQQYYHQTATVIKSSKDKSSNFLTLNKGEINGIKRNTGIIGTKGVIGYVIASSSHYATVLPVIHPKFKLSVRHKKTKSIGLLSWEKEDTWQTATINDIANFVTVNIGDTLETTGGDTFFPEGTIIGIVKETEEIPGKGTQFITINLIENFGNIHTVFAIQNVSQIEQIQLEDSVIIDE